MPLKRKKRPPKRQSALAKVGKAPAIISVLPLAKKRRAAGAIFWLGNDIYEAMSDTVPDLPYMVAVCADESIPCACPHYKKHRGKLCKHGRRVKAAHHAYTGQQRELWPIPHRVPAEACVPKNPIMTSREFYKRNVRRAIPPFIRYADNRTMLAHRESMRCKWETRAIILLKDLLVAIELCYPQIIRPYHTGPHGRSTTERVFAIQAKVIERKSLARTVQRIDRIAYQDILGEVLGINSLQRYFQDSYVNDALDKCLLLMGNAVSPITTIVNVDSSGFPTLAQCNYRSDDRGREKIRPYMRYYRGHFISCAATNIVAAVITSFSYGTNSSDHSQFIPLLEKALQVWRFMHVAADKAYFSDAHLKAVNDLGAIFVCPPPIKWKPENSEDPLLARRHLAFYNSDEFDEWYSWRGKIESVFATIEMLYGKALWARGPYGEPRPLTSVPLPIQIEMKSKALAQNLVQFAFLEAVLEQELSFTQNRMLYPIALDRVESGRTLLAA